MKGYTKVYLMSATVLMGESSGGFSSFFFRRLSKKFIFTEEIPFPNCTAQGVAPPHFN